MHLGRISVIITYLSVKTQFEIDTMIQIVRYKHNGYCVVWGCRARAFCVSLTGEEKNNNIQ